ncbi:MAG: methyltransferase regulatory domain-containing protein [Candidatus Binatia bacterium]
MSDAAANVYDTILYPGFPLAQAHPNRLATLATLLGMTPARVEQCRVLEVGCGDGTNLISVALGLPEAHCVGFDLAAAGIEKGQAVIKKLGLTNTTLQTMDLMDIGREFGQFDFIIAHGFYSWVPEAVRDKLLSVCSENLAPNGVAYVSYNTYPGAHLRNMVRDMMRFHVSEFSDSQQRVAQARAIVKFLAGAAKTDDGVYPQILQKEEARIAGFRDSSLFHDDLAECNAPVYFYQFVEHAARYGLKYLAEAQFFEMQAGIFAPDVVETVNQISDSLIAKEQYLDFLKGRRFRQTLLCHSDRELEYSLTPDKIFSFSVASPLRCESPSVNLQPGQVVTFVGPKNSSLATDNPVIKAALLALGEAWPQAIPFNELLAKARSACRGDSATVEETATKDTHALSDLLLRAYAGNVVELHICPPRFVTQVSERPQVSPLARLQSREHTQVTNLRHHTITVDNEFVHYLLPLLDGSRDRGAVIEALMALVESSTLAIEREGGGESTIDEIRTFLAAELDRNLDQLAQQALLVA